MLQTEATLIKFDIRSKSYLFVMARLRTAFNACGFLMYCDEGFVSWGHRLSMINYFTRVNDPPSEHPSADSCSGSGDDSDSPRIRRDMRETAEVSDDEQRQQPKVSTSKENNTPPSSRNSYSNRNSDTGSPNSIIEYKDMQNCIDLTEENVQGIVSLHMERKPVKGKTRQEALERLMPTVVLEDINKRKNNKGHFEPK